MIRTRSHSNTDSWGLFELYCVCVSGHGNTASKLLNLVSEQFPYKSNFIVEIVIFSVHSCAQRTTRTL